MAAPQIKGGFIDLSNDDDDDKDKKKKPRKKRTSMVHDRAQNLTCWICGDGIMQHQKKVLVRGQHGCVVCGNFCENDKLTYCTNEDCRAVWCRGCWRKQNHINHVVARKQQSTDSKDDK